MRNVLTVMLVLAALVTGGCAGSPYPDGLDEPHPEDAAVYASAMPPGAMLEHFRPTSLEDALSDTHSVVVAHVTAVEAGPVIVGDGGDRVPTLRITLAIDDVVWGDGDLPATVTWQPPAGTDVTTAVESAAAAELPTAPGLWMLRSVVKGYAEQEAEMAKSGKTPTAGWKQARAFEVDTWYPLNSQAVFTQGEGHVVAPMAGTTEADRSGPATVGERYAKVSDLADAIADMD